MIFYSPSCDDLLSNRVVNLYTYLFIWEKTPNSKTVLFMFLNVLKSVNLHSILQLFAWCGPVGTLGSKKGGIVTIKAAMINVLFCLCKMLLV